MNFCVWGYYRKKLKKRERIELWFVQGQLEYTYNMLIYYNYIMIMSPYWARAYYTGITELAVLNEKRVDPDNSIDSEDTLELMRKFLERYKVVFSWPSLPGRVFLDGGGRRFIVGHHLRERVGLLHERPRVGPLLPHSGVGSVDAANHQFVMVIPLPAQVLWLLILLSPLVDRILVLLHFIFMLLLEFGGFALVLLH